MAHRRAWRHTVLALVICLGVGGLTHANWYDDFTQDGPGFDPRWSTDTPDTGRGDVWLDTAADSAHFAAYAQTDMWGNRNAAPILWTPAPDGNYAVETHLSLNRTTNTVVGLTVYGDVDGSLPNFSYGYDYWTTPSIRLQGLGDNNPNIGVGISAGDVWLRLEYFADSGVSGQDLYVTKYKLAGPNPWTTLAHFPHDVPNDRIGLFIKTNAGGPTADFHYVALEDIPAPTLWSVDIQTPGAGLMSGVEPLYGQGNVWNAFDVAHHGGTSVNPSMMLVDTDGNPSPVTFSVLGTVSGWNGGGTLQQDYLFINAGGADPNITWSLTGLEPNMAYELFAYGQTGTHRDFNMAIDMDGDGSLLNDVAQRIGNTGFLFQEITADANGVIIGNATNLGPGAEGNWTGFQLRLLPEPGTLTLLGIGLLAAARRRRRR